MTPTKEQVNRIASILGTRALPGGRTLNSRMKAAGINRKARRAYLSAARKHKKKV